VSRRRKLLTIVVIAVLEALLIGILPYFLSQGRDAVPFPSLCSEYSYAVNVQGYSVSGSLVLTTGKIVNSSYIEVTEAIQAATGSDSASFYVNLVNRSIIISQGLTPELPTHGEYYDLWIGEGHTAGETLNILNQTVTLSASGLRFYGWTFFNTVTANNLSFNMSSLVQVPGITSADYHGKITIIYDQATGLMLEDHQEWIVNYVQSGLAQTLSYTVTFAYAGSNVRFTYFTYALTTGIYLTIITVLGAVTYTAVNIVRKRRAARPPPPEELFQTPPQTPPETPPEPSPQTPPGKEDEKRSAPTPEEPPERSPPRWAPP
jgi:hypothetical protein